MKIFAHNAGILYKLTGVLVCNTELFYSGKCVVLLSICFVERILNRSVALKSVYLSFPFWHLFAHKRHDKVNYTNTFEFKTEKISRLSTFQLHPPFQKQQRKI